MIPHADIVYSSNSKLIAVAANHLSGLSIFNQGQGVDVYNDPVLQRLSYTVDLNPAQNSILAGTTECSLDILNFDVVFHIY
jgi:hypothetical protein